MEIITHHFSERAALKGKHFESSDYTTGGSLKGDCTETQ